MFFPWFTPEMVAAFYAGGRQAPITTGEPYSAEAGIKAKQGTHPTEEERRHQLSVERQQSMYSHELVAENEEDWVYAQIPEEILGINCVGCWIGPTPRAVEEVIDAITECWQYIRDFGTMPFKKVPEDLTDEECLEIISELDSEMDVQAGGWHSAAGFTAKPAFGAGLSIEDVRTIVAHIQEAMRASGVRAQFDEAEEREQEENERRILAVVEEQELRALALRQAAEEARRDAEAAGEEDECTDMDT